MGSYLIFVIYLYCSLPGVYSHVLPPELYGCSFKVVSGDDGGTVMVVISYSTAM